MYQARITNKNPLRVIILLDHSGSMAEETIYRGRKMSKSEALSITINMLLGEIVARSRREEGIRDYFDIAIFGYCGNGVTSLLAPMGKFITPSELAQKAGVRIHNFEFERIMPSGNVVVSSHPLHVWIEPQAMGDTPMGAAMEQAYRMLRKLRNKNSFPPIVFNITDGEASDADAATLTAIAEKIVGTSTNEGNSLLFNIHLSSRGQNAVVFPSSSSQLPDERYAQLLYKISSTLPDCFDKALTAMYPDVTLPVKAMSHNCSVAEIFSMLQIGTISILTNR